MEQAPVVQGLRRTEGQLHQRFGRNRIVLLPVVDVDLCQIGIVLFDHPQSDANLFQGRVQDPVGVVRVEAVQEGQPRLFVARVLLEAVGGNAMPVAAFRLLQPADARQVFRLTGDVPEGKGMHWPHGLPIEPAAVAMAVGNEEFFLLAAR